MLRLANHGLESDVIPQAIFWRPLIYFTTSIREGEDGLDMYEEASFSLDNQLSFDLRHYRGHPGHTVTLYLAFSLQKEAEIVAVVDTVLQIMAVPKLAVAWKRGWEFEFGSLHRVEGDRLKEAEARILALKIASQEPNRRASTELIKHQIPQYYPLSEIDLQYSPSRKRECRWQQIVGNVVSHQKTQSGIFAMGYAERTFDGIQITRNGIDYLNNIGFST
ncbi:MAG TPA: hypothetical protein VHW66_12130 [Stellaceae bacterium]|jgi:hypothetical protein|nr:hypothetical protein [Stellaceae bacterium]